MAVKVKTTRVRDGSESVKVHTFIDFPIEQIKTKTERKKKLKELYI